MEPSATADLDHYPTHIKHLKQFFGRRLVPVLADGYHGVVTAVVICQCPDLELIPYFRGDRMTLGGSPCNGLGSGGP